MAKDDMTLHNNEDLKPLPPVSTGAIAIDAESPDESTDSILLKERTMTDKVREADIAGKIRGGGERLANQAGEKARGLVTQGLERASETLANVSRMVGDTADGIEERLGQEYGDYARKAASALDRTATSLGSKDPDELIEDTRTFVRNSPGVALAGAAVVGFVLARLVKSGLGTGSSDENDDRA